jgi:hypothetical protein
MIRTAFIALLLTFLLHGLAAAQDDHKRFHGTWRMTSYEGDIGDNKKYEVRFAAGQVTWLIDGKVTLEGKCHIAEPTKHAKRGLWKWDNGVTDAFIYFFVGEDTLVTCWRYNSPDWPTVFATGGTECGHYLFVWKREK